MSQEDDPKGPANADTDAALGADELDQISGGAFDTFIKIDSKEMLNPQPLPP